MSRAAPPGNDDFQSAYALSGLPASAEASNQEATRQSKEPNSPDGYGRGSLWWRWTAPSSGWVEMNTAGSSYDTTLAAYSGSTLSGLTLLKYNDDARKTEQSRLRFQAVEGTEYRIQVQSWFQASGTAKLQILASAAPQAPTLQMLTLTPDHVVAQNSNDHPWVDARVSIIAPDGVTSATVLLQGPREFAKSSIDLYGLPESASVYTGGNVLSHISASDGQTYFLGDWQVRLRVTDDFGETLTYGGPGEPALPAGSTLALKAGGADDVRPPKVTNISTTPEVVDITDGGKTVSLQVSANDDNRIASFVVQLCDSQGRVISYSDALGPEPNSGTSKDGIWLLSAGVPSYSGPGTYYVKCFAYDDLGRSQAPAQKTITVVNNGAQDVTSPEITAVSMSAARVALTGTLVEISMRIEVSDEGPIQDVSSNYVGETARGAFMLRKVSGAGRAEVWEGTLKLDGSEAPGTFPMQYSVTDSTGNQTVLRGGDVTSLGPIFHPVPAGFPAFFTITPGPADAYSVWRAKYPGLADT